MDSRGMLIACITLIVVSLVLPAAAGVVGETVARTLSSASLAAGMLAAFMAVR